MLVLKLLIVEDDQNIRRLISKFLSMNGYDCLEAVDGKAALALYENHHIDLVLTDIMMPFMDGNTLTAKLRSLNRDLPILMVTALDRFADKEKGYQSGADDYLVKPLDMQEMLLRIKALLRRSQIMTESKIVLPHLLLDERSSLCVVDGVTISLTRKEFMLLFKLLSSPNRIFTREQLMNEIWGFDSESYDRTVDTHVKRIREQVSSPNFEIVTVRGLGYKAVILL